MRHRTCDENSTACDCCTCVFEIERIVGEITGDKSQEAKGLLKQAEVKAQEKLGDAKEKLGDAKEALKDATK
jgi:uncharacterized protein YjbJ (UPF0337 family)